MGVSAAVVGAGVVGSYLSSQAAGDAADTQAAAANRAADLQRQTAQEQLGLQKQMYNEQVGRLSPYLQAGQDALTQLRTGLEAGGRFNKPFEFQQTDPSYQWRFNQGQRALEANAAARGGSFSAGQLQALQNYGQNAASQEYGNEFNRYQTDIARQYNALHGLASDSQNAAAGLGSAGQNLVSASGQTSQNMANNVSSLMGDAANAQAAGRIAQQNQMNSLLGNVAGFGLNAYTNNQANQAANYKNWELNQLNSSFFGA